MDDVRNLKLICSLLHELRRKNFPVYGNIDEMIAVAEKMYDERKGK